MKLAAPFLIILLMASACDPFNTKLNEEDVYYYAVSAEDTVTSHFSKSDPLKVMTWNIKFGGARIDFFFDCHGNRIIMDSTEVLANLDQIVDFINHTKPDILFVQEIDVNSKRSAFIDQVNRILNNTHFSHAVYSPQWRATHIPSDGLGKMNSGNAIFSVTPLFAAKRISLPLIEEQNFLVRYFYLRRNLLEARTAIGKDTIRLLNTHLSAYSSDGTKKKQIDLVFNYLDSLDRSRIPFIIGGDFNALPPGTEKVKGFPDSACDDGDFEADDYSAEQAWMTPFYEYFEPAVSLKKYRTHNASYFTHTTDKNGFWNRKLDYIFSNQEVLQGSSITHQTSKYSGLKTMPLSDHCAITTRVIIKE
ncbi:endonuclease/exonuclease/phosphatase family protein [Anaerophaga thermohalophila]|uniref:endonuclease/exonuclease/phosphatase family protein n=1 Tax=Anaerophaga thermohalophila TaxID=177400 RepID=UPI00030A3377|nr:endonuclease/exonuclease/phosphatase family protein [Anaerophaga thermohalophila]